MNKAEQGKFLEEYGLETYGTIYEVLDDRDFLEDLGYDVDSVLTDYLKLINVEQ